MLAYIALIVRSATIIRDIVIDTVIIPIIKEIMLIIIIMISINIIRSTVRRGWMSVKVAADLRRII